MVTLQGVSQEEVQLRFVENIDYTVFVLRQVLPQPDLDYIATRQEDGSLQYGWIPCTIMSLSSL